MAQGSETPRPEKTTEERHRLFAEALDRFNWGAAARPVTTSEAAPPAGTKTLKTRAERVARMQELLS
jgi:hypothetical protein